MNTLQIQRVQVGIHNCYPIIERLENSYWKIRVNQFQAWMLGFYQFDGEWKTTEVANNKIKVEYTYTLYADNVLLYPINWLFAKTFWKMYMQKVLENVKNMAYQNEKYLYK